MVFFVDKSSGGRPRQNYWLSSDTAQELVMSSRCEKAREIKKSIIKLLDEHADGKWISVAQGKIMWEFLNEFKFIENQKKAEKIAIEHLSKHFVNNKYNYAMANKHRNQQLSYTTEQVRTEYEDFCKKNNMQIYKSLTKTQMTYYFNKYLLIRNAVWDFLIVKEYSNNPIEISEFVCRIAEEWGVEIYPKNEDNLFQSQESNKDLEYSELEVQKLELPTQN